MTPFVPWILNQCWEKRYISFSIKLKSLKSPYEEFWSHIRQKVEISSFYSHRDKMWIGIVWKLYLFSKWKKGLPKLILHGMSLTLSTKYIMCVLSAQSCPTLCYPMDCSLPASSVHGIFQARTLEWVASSYSRKYMIFLLKLFKTIYLIVKICINIMESK